MGPKLAGINGVITSINGYYKWGAKGYNPTKNELFRPIYSDRRGPPCVKSVCFWDEFTRPFGKVGFSVTSNDDGKVTA